MSVHSQSELRKPSGAAGAVQCSEVLKLTVYSPGSPLAHPVRLVTEIFKDVWQRRELTAILLMRDLKAQFRQSFLGYAWLIIPPLVSAMVWQMLNAQHIIQVSMAVSYPAFVLIGTTLWAAFSATLNAPSDVILQNREVFVKLNVPVESFILAGAARAVFNLAVTCAVMFPLLLCQGVSLKPIGLLFPLAAACVMVSAFSIGMLLAPLGALYSDFRSAILPFLSVLMFTAPVVFPVPTGDGLLARVVRHCPLTPAIALSRDVLMTGSLEWLGLALLWLCINLLLLLAAFIGLRVARPHIIARMGM